MCFAATGLPGMSDCTTLARWKRRPSHGPSWISSPGDDCTGTKCRRFSSVSFTPALLLRCQPTRANMKTGSSIATPLRERRFDAISKTFVGSKLGTSRALSANFMPHFLGFWISLGRRLGSRVATQLTGAYLQKRFRSPQLRALLTSQWGDYGLPPSRSAFAIHATIVGHYLHGAWFPEGGSGRIARSFERGIEAYGGSLHVCQEVTSIIVEQERAVGVRAIDRRGAEPREVEYRAPVIISDVGARSTYGRLLPTKGVIGGKTARVRSFVDNLEGDISAVTLYLRLKAPVSSLGIKGENVWVNTDTDHDSLPEQGRGTLEGRPSHIYVSFPSAKSGEGKFHTAEIITFLDDAAFAAWKDRPHGNRGPDYSSLKERIADGLVDLAETAIPGLKALVSYRELSTPLTVEHYTSHPRGRFYGLPAVPQRYRSTLLGPVTPIKGLYLSGSDAGSLGIVGAMMGGVGAATKILGPFGFFRIMAAVQGGKVSPTAATRSLDKKRAVLVSKRRITPTIWELRWKLDEPVRFAPGQFARLRVADEEWRDYSIASVADGEVTLLVSTRTGGRGSLFAEGAAVGTESEIELPPWELPAAFERSAPRLRCHGNGARTLSAHVERAARPRRSGKRRAAVRLCDADGQSAFMLCFGSAAINTRLSEPRGTCVRRFPWEGDGSPWWSYIRSRHNRFLRLRFRGHGLGLQGSPRKGGGPVHPHGGLLMRGGGFKDSEIYLLHEITTRLDRIARLRFLAPSGITYPEFLVLMSTRELPAPTQEEVSAFVDMSKSLVSQRVSALMKKGFLRQDGDPGNRRKVKLGLTGAGEQEVARIYDAMISASTKLFDAMGDFRPAFHDALIRMAEDLAREEGLTRPR